MLSLKAGPHNLRLRLSNTMLLFFVSLAILVRIVDVYPISLDE